MVSAQRVTPQYRICDAWAIGGPGTSTTSRRGAAEPALLANPVDRGTPGRAYWRIVVISILKARAAAKTRSAVRFLKRSYPGGLAEDGGPEDAPSLAGGGGRHSAHSDPDRGASGPRRSSRFLSLRLASSRRWRIVGQ